MRNCGVLAWEAGVGFETLGRAGFLAAPRLPLAAGMKQSLALGTTVSRVRSQESRMKPDETLAEIPSDGHIPEDLAAHLLRVVDDPATHGIPELHFHFWRSAPESVKQAYLASFRSDPEQRRFFEQRWFAPDYDYRALGDLPAGTLGRVYHDHVVGQGLDPSLLTKGYPAQQRAAELSNQLEGMPEEYRYSTLRGFQMHDILHALTGYSTSPLDELALQAFGLAQGRGPYAAFWMSVATTRIAFLNPQFIVPVMDAITRGWEHGRRARTLAFEHWEERFEEPVVKLREEFRIA
jgi:ubiquinone biosynthesis protein Coq4